MKIVAEIGSNHCGQWELALAHIEAAAQCGVTGVKFQLFQPTKLDRRSAYQQELAKWALPPEWIPELARAAHSHGLEFLCTPFDLEMCELLRGWVDGVKISAYDLTYDALLTAAASLQAPLILSTAMATWQEIEHAVELVSPLLAPVRENRAQAALTLLQGVAQYPCRVQDMNLNVLRQMQARFRDVAVGISDHSWGWTAALVSVAVGGSMIEKHFMVDESIQSPDAVVSITAASMRILVSMVHLTEFSLGGGEKTGPLPCEQALFETCRRSNDKPLRG